LPAATTGDLHPLAALGLPGIAFMEQLNVVVDGLLVVPLDASELLVNVHPVMIGHLDVTTLHDNVHRATSSCCPIGTSWTPKAQK
jgi:hypothetical protein